MQRTAGHCEPETQRPRKVRHNLALEHADKVDTPTEVDTRLLPCSQGLKTMILFTYDLWGLMINETAIVERTSTTTDNRVSVADQI